MTQLLYSMSERISEEERSDVLHMPRHASPSMIEDDLLSLFNQSFEKDIPVAGDCDAKAFYNSIGFDTQPNILDSYLTAEQVSNPNEGQDTYQALIQNPSILPYDLFTMPMSPIRPTVSVYPPTAKKVKPIIPPIPLSQSVGVGLPQPAMMTSHQISLIHELEEFFRPRYKSDYFAQSGKTRKPRYVADRKGNHFVSLRVPRNVQGSIRVDWLTIPTEDGDMYSMPYRFQASNEEAEVPDCNPLYVPIQADNQGLMKLYLVLIKSKQDELKTLQPLKPFRPVQDAFGVPDKNFGAPVVFLTPKNLIQKYQLEKSLLAFTFCSIGHDGKTYIPEWDTTVYSTVMSELSPEVVRQKIVACPNCQTTFSVNISLPEDERAEEPTPSKRKSKQPIDGIQTAKGLKKSRSSDG